MISYLSSYAVLFNLKSLMLIFFQALGMEIYNHHSVYCAVTDREPVAVLSAYSLYKNTVMEHSHA
jgi:hypothetical protein